jgi:thiamine transport system substrate-binding protein
MFPRFAKAFPMLCSLILLSLALPLRAQSTLRVIAHDSFNYSESVMEAFTEETGVAVEVLRAGDAGTMLNQTILTRENPLADVLYGIDNTFLSRALDNDIFIPYEAPALEDVTDEFKLDDEYRVTPIDYGDVCLNYDVAYFAEQDLDVPESLEDLTDPAYRGLLVVQNPAASSPGLAFLLTTIGVFGEDDDYDYLDYWAELVENDVQIVEDWETAYFGEFTVGSEDGTRPLVVSYASSPPVEVVFAEEPVETAPSAAITADDTCLRQIEFAGILRGSENIEAAQQFIDFLLSREFQEDMPLNMYVFPVLPEAELPDVFLEYASIAENPVVIDYAAIEQNRETWIQAWTEVALR